MALHWKLPKWNLAAAGLISLLAPAFFIFIFLASHFILSNSGPLDAGLMPVFTQTSVSCPGGSKVTALIFTCDSLALGGHNLTKSDTSSFSVRHASSDWWIHIKHPAWLTSAQSSSSSRKKKLTLDPPHGARYVKQTFNIDTRPCRISTAWSIPCHPR